MLKLDGRKYHKGKCQECSIKRGWGYKKLSIYIAEYTNQNITFMYSGDHIYASMAIHVLQTPIESLHQRLSNFYLHTDDSIYYFSHSPR